MKTLTVLVAVSLTASIGCAEQSTEQVETPNAPPASPTATDNPAATNAPAAPGVITVQEMLLTGPTQLKLHSLAMISQGNVKGEVDASYLPGFKVCTEDSALPIRSVTAQLLGQHYIQGKEHPNPEAVDLLTKLARDESSYVRYNAVYHGLTQIQNKSDEIIDLLIEIASKDREAGLLDRIAESLKPEHDHVVEILDRKLKDGGNVAQFEIYEDLTGEEPPYQEKYMEMASSLPRLFIFKGQGADPETLKAELETALQEAGVKNPLVQVSGSGDNHVLLLKTYLTKDRLTVEQAFADHPKFRITQSMWLTPEMENQIDDM